MKLLDELAKHVGAQLPSEAEDIVLSMESMEAVAKHFFKLATDSEYVTRLSDIRDRLQAKGDRQALDAVISELSADRGGDDSMIACRGQADRLVAHLTVARGEWDEWVERKPSASKKDSDKWKPQYRNHVLNAEDGDSAKPGTNPEYSALLVDGALARKATSVPAALDSLRCIYPVHAAAIDAEASTVERVLRELGKLEDVASVAGRGVDMSDDKHVSMAALSFPLGMQGLPLGSRVATRPLKLGVFAPPQCS